MELGAPALATLSHGAGGGAVPNVQSDFQVKLQQAREQVNLARKDLAMTESAQHMYEKFRDKSRSKNACQFCRRGFDTEASRNEFENSVERLIVKIPSFLEESKRRETEVQTELDNCEALRPKWDRLEQLRVQEIPRKQKEVNQAIEDERAVMLGLEPVEKEQKRLEERHSQLQNLRAEAATLTRMARIVEDLRGQLRVKETRLLGANSKVSLQAERDQLRTMNEQLTELSREEEAVRTQRDLLAKQQDQLRTQLAEQKGRLQLLQAQVARRGDVDAELTARQADARDCGQAAQRARAAAEASNARVEELRKEREALMARFRANIDAQDSSVRSLQREVDALTEIEKSINVMRNRVENADALKAHVKGADDAQRAAERDLGRLRAELERRG